MVEIRATVKEGEGGNPSHIALYWKESGSFIYSRFLDPSWITIPTTPGGWMDKAILLAAQLGLVGTVTEVNVEHRRY